MEIVRSATSFIRESESFSGSCDPAKSCDYDFIQDHVTAVDHMIEFPFLSQLWSGLISFCVPRQLIDVRGAVVVCERAALCDSFVILSRNASFSLERDVL